jgi:hypothetical protein
MPTESAFESSPQAVRAARSAAKRLAQMQFEDLKVLVLKNPGPALLGAAALGFILVRSLRGRT